MEVWPDRIIDRHVVSGSFAGAYSKYRPVQTSKFVVRRGHQKFIEVFVCWTIGTIGTAELLELESEARRLRLAKNSLGRVLVVAYTIRRKDNEEITRIISARRASRKERKRYEVEED